MNAKLVIGMKLQGSGRDRSQRRRIRRSLSLKAMQIVHNRFSSPAERSKTTISRNLQKSHFLAAPHNEAHSRRTSETTNIMIVEQDL